MKTISLALLLGLLPARLLADVTCTFPTECMEGEDCYDSGYSLTVVTEMDIAGLVNTDSLSVSFPVDDQIENDAGPVGTAHWMMQGEAFAVTASGQGGFHLLTFDGNGAARYSVHLPAAELSILYLGTCAL